MSYSDKLKDPRWQRKRLEVLQRDDFTCKHCFDDKSTLHVHHIGYMGVEPWDTPSSLLITLCEECHSIEEESIKKAGKNIIDVLRKSGKIASEIDMTANFLQSFNLKYKNELDAVCWFLSNQENVNNVMGSYLEFLKNEGRENDYFKF